MKRFTKVISLVLSFIMLASMLCGCSGGKKTVHTGDTYTYWVSLDNNVGQTHQSFGELMLYQEMEKRTGTKIQFMHPSAGSTGDEAFQVLLASGDYPDMVEHNWSVYPGGSEQASKDGIIICLNKYMEEHAPNYYGLMEGEKAKENGYMYKASTVSEDGNYYGFKNLNVGRYRGYQGLFVRKDLLTKWGLDVPETIDDWDKFFEAAKKDGIKYPLTGNKAVLRFFATAWKHYDQDFYIENGKVKFGPFEKSYKAYVEKLAEWMKKGYIDIDYITNDNTIINGQITNGTSVAANCYVSNISKLLAAMEERNPEFDLVACPFPVMKKGEVPFFQPYQAPASDPMIAITAQCGMDNEERYKEAIKWCDYLFSEEGMVLKSFGIEGDTFTIETGDDGEKHYVYTDKILKNYEQYGASNIGAALYYHFLPANHPGFNQHPDYFRGYYPYDQQMDALETWNKYVEEAANHVFPAVTYSADEASRKATIEAAGKDNLTAAISNIILGKASVDTLDDAVKSVKKSGYDELLKINQTAYDRYVKAIKQFIVICEITDKVRHFY